MASKLPYNVQLTLTNDNFSGYRFAKTKNKRQRFQYFQVSINKAVKPIGLGSQEYDCLIPVSVFSAN